MYAGTWIRSPICFATGFSIKTKIVFMFEKYVSAHLKRNTGLPLVFKSDFLHEDTFLLWKPTVVLFLWSVHAGPHLRCSDWFYGDTLVFRFAFGLLPCKSKGCSTCVSETRTKTIAVLDIIERKLNIANDFASWSNEAYVESMCQHR